MTIELACNLDALTSDQRRRHRELASKLRPAVVEFLELPDGYTARLDCNMNNEVSEFCELELKCCPFFELVVSLEEGESMLTITGPGDIKPFIRSEFGIPGGGLTDA